MNERRDTAPTLILAGGGHAHVEVLRQFGLKRPEGIRIVLISPDSHTPYSGMIPGLIAGHYTWDDCHIDVRPLCDVAGAEFVSTRIVDIDPAARHVRCADGRSYRFDVLSLDVGSTPDLQAVPGAAEHAIPVKPVAAFLEAWQQLVAGITREGAPRRLAVVGGGAGGVEVALAMRYRLGGAESADAPQIALVTTDLMATHPRRVQALLERALIDHRVTLVRDCRVTQVTAGVVHGASGEHIPADLIVWVTGASAPAWIRQSGMHVDVRGFVAVNDHLQSTSHPFVFAAGDVATMTSGPLAKAGVFAVRQGPVLAGNLRRYLAPQPLRPFRPQRRFLSLMSTGGRHAVASWAGLGWQGRWVWRWKDRIDRTFMRTYHVASQADSRATRSR